MLSLPRWSFGDARHAFECTLARRVAGLCGKIAGEADFRDARFLLGTLA